jgi:hypothetical protein
MHRSRIRTPLAVALLVLPLAAGAAQTPDTDTNRAGRFDLGRMWTFEYAPAQYFSETYHFTADSAWFARARLAALRIPGCSASFVSPNGLIATNHHCARGAVVRVTRPGETLLDSGFVAHTLDEERRVNGFYADQVIAIADITDEVFAAVDRARSDAERETARGAVVAAAQARLRQQYATPGDSIWVQIVPLYNGGRWSAYVFRRFTDIRLVVAPELQMGFFGGDPDNFTFPRYDLDFSILRVYGQGGQPYHPEAWFRWGRGVQPGDAVFVIGNPGSTSRLSTISQMEYQRDVSVPAAVGYLTTRLNAMQEYFEQITDPAERSNLRNSMFGLSNSLKSLSGSLEALHDPVIVARRRDAERMLRDSIRARGDLRQRYGTLFDRMAEVQRQKARYATAYAAFAQLLGGGGSTTLQLAFWGYRIQHGPADSAAYFRQRLARVQTQPRDLERRFLALGLADIARAYGPAHALTRAALGGLTADAAADALRAASALGDTAGASRAVRGELPADDAAMRLMAALAPAMLEMQRELARLGAAEGVLAEQLGRARFEVYGRSIPPDGTFSPRIADGVVQGYAYNGTLAPAYTTFYGIYDRYSSFGPTSEWSLPYRWRTPPAGLDLSTPLNFASTADTYGGNSGSPAVTRDLELVGLNFDRNINALVRDYIYLPERGRNVMVDVRAIQAALERVYGAHRVVQELLTGRLFRTEAEADQGR